MNQHHDQLKRILSIGDIITISINLYREQFWGYFRLSIIAFLWLLIPLYGWIQFLTIKALISRLVFQELSGFPETVGEAKIYLKYRGLDSLLILILVWILILIVLFTAIIATYYFFWQIIHIEHIIQWLIRSSYILENGIIKRTAIYIGRSLFVIILLIIIGFILIPPIWIYCRLLIADLPLALEEKVNIFTILRRSFQLTQGYFWKLQILLIIATLVWLPLEFILWFFYNIYSWIFAWLIYSFDMVNYYFFDWLNMFILWLFLLVNLAAILPFWQTIKAVVYYNLRLRREGVNLVIY